MGIIAPLFANHRSDTTAFLRNLSWRETYVMIVFLKLIRSVEKRRMHDPPVETKS